jgi:TolB-like protein
MQDAYFFDRGEFRPTERLLLVDGAPMAVGARAFDLLACLLAHRDRVVLKSELLEAAWPGLVVEENNISVQVSVLRKLLGDKAIATVPGLGYRFAMEVRVGVASAPGAPPAPCIATNRPTIAVLPFNVLADDPRMAFLADGLAEDVIALLARVPGFRLISHASSFAFRAHDASLTEVARQLGVRFVVEGSLRPTATAVRITTHLTDAQTGHVLWNGRFDCVRAEMADLQEQIARGILSELEPELTRAEIAHIRRQRPDNLDAWAHYHEAVGAIALQGWNEDGIGEARARLRACLALDPLFGLAHAHYAMLTALARNIGLLPEAAAGSAAAADATPPAERAVELDDGSPEVLGLAGCALCDLGQLPRGMTMLRRALELDPSNAQAHVALGAESILTSEFEAGVERMRLGMAISPRDRRLGFWGWALGVFLLRADRAAEALAEALASSQRDPRFHFARVLQAAALDRHGQTDQARIALAEARRLRTRLSLNEIALTHGRRVAEQLRRYWD